MVADRRVSGQWGAGQRAGNIQVIIGLVIEVAQVKQKLCAQLLCPLQSPGEFVVATGVADRGKAVALSERHAPAQGQSPLGTIASD